MSSETAYAKEYLSMVDEVKELKLALENIELADRNDLYKLVYTKQKLESWIDSGELEEKLEKDIQRFIAYIVDILDTVEKNKEGLKKLKLNLLKARVEKVQIDIGKFITNVFLSRLFKIVILIIAIVAFSRVSNNVVDVLNDTATELNNELNNGELAIKLVRVITTCIFVGVIINFVSNIILLCMDTIYVLVPNQTIVKVSMVTQDLRELINETKDKNKKNTIDYEVRAKNYWSAVKEFVDKLNNSTVDIKDRHHAKTFIKSKDEMVQQIESINTKLNNKRYIVQLEGLADAELIYKNTFINF